MEVLSSAHHTVLSGFPELKTKCVHHQADSETVDFQFFPLSRLFIEVDKKSGLELLQIKNVEDKGPEISRVRKLRMDNVFCAACPKQRDDHEIAFGLSNGIIKLINYRTSECTVKFAPDNNRNGIIFLDFNASNEYLSAVQEKGSINLYGLKTKAKLETINFDNDVTLSRFHPTKRFHMAAASYNGSVFVHDIQSKRKVFTSLECHGAPCKDVCMSPTQPDVLLSVGFDCIVNIFDVRKKTPPLQIRGPHPLSAVAISDCGYFSCVGNLKGELISYDLRNTKQKLYSEKIHDTGVVRVAFVAPSAAAVANNSGETSNSLSFGQNNADAITEPRKSVPINEPVSQPKRDSFADYLEFHSYKLKVPGNRFSSRRESFDWELLNRKQSRPSSDFRRSTAGRLSTESLHPFDGKPRNYVDFDSVDEIEEEGIVDSAHCPEKTAIENSEKKLIPAEVVEDCAAEQDVGEEQATYHMQETCEAHETPQRSTRSTLLSQGDDSDKENMLNLLNKDIECFPKLSGNRNSTPNKCRRSSDLKMPSNSANCGGIPDVMAELQKIRTEMDSKFSQLESEIRYTAESNKWNMFTQNWNLWRKQMDISEEIQASVECLLQTDPFVNEFLRLQKENEHLKKALADLNRPK